MTITFAASQKLVEKSKSTLIMKRTRLKEIFTSCGKNKIPDDDDDELQSPSSSSVLVDVREEYANAFRTESYFDFWTRVLDLTNHDTATRRSIDSSISAPRERLPSYRLFAEQLLEPDQASVTKLLDDEHRCNDTKALLYDYFSKTANASLLCGLLLKDIDHVRNKYRSLNKAFNSLGDDDLSPNPTSSLITPSLIEFTNNKSSQTNPFASSSTKLTIVQSNCSKLLQQLESARTKLVSHLRLLKTLKRGTAITIAALTVTLTAILVCHGVAIAAVALPGFAAAPSRSSLLRLWPTTNLDKRIAMLDAASKGSYILSRDLDTLSRLMTRLQDEFEHLRSVTGFWLKIIGKDRVVRGCCDVVRQLKRNESSFREQLDELEEHLYLCFMTINRARNLVTTLMTNSKPP